MLTTVDGPDANRLDADPGPKEIMQRIVIDDGGATVGCFGVLATFGDKGQEDSRNHEAGRDHEDTAWSGQRP